MKKKLGVFVILLSAVCAPAFTACSGSPWRACDGGTEAQYYVKRGAWAIAVNIEGGVHFIGGIYYAHKASFGAVTAVSVTHGVIEIKAGLPVYEAAAILVLGDNKSYITIYHGRPGFTMTPEEYAYTCKAEFESGKKARTEFSIAALKEAHGKL